MVTPPEDRGEPLYPYYWDYSGDEPRVARRQYNRASRTERPAPGRSRPARRPSQRIAATSTGDNLSSPTSPRYTQRNQHRGTTSESIYSSWQSSPTSRPSRDHGRRSPERGSAGQVEEDIIPDYIVRFILREEAPRREEAPVREQAPKPAYRRRRHSAVILDKWRESDDDDENGARTAMPRHRVDVVTPQNNQQHQSRVADIEAVQLDGADRPAALERVDSREGDEAQRFLLGDVGKEGRENGGAEGRGNGDGGWRCFAVGWRAGVTLNVLLALLILLIGFVCLVVAISGVSAAAGSFAVFAGPCATASRIDWGLHTVINVAVVALLAGANYAFQILGSPTRGEVTAAHLRGKWLDIGIPSFRNLARIEKTRAFLAVVILAAAVLAQVLYNAVIFVTQTAPDPNVTVVNESSLSKAILSNGDSSASVAGLVHPDLFTLRGEAARGRLSLLSTRACLDQLSGPLETDYAAVYLVSTALDSEPLIRISKASNKTVISDLIAGQSSIKYCLAQAGPLRTCEININPSLLGCVTLLNSLALVASAALLFKRPSSFHPLATLGDAVSSFLKETDPTTRGSCLLSKTDVIRGRWPLAEAKHWVPQTHYWMRSASFPRWAATVAIWLACVAVAAVLLALSLANDTLPRLSPTGAASSARVPMPLQSIPLPPPPQPSAAALAVLASLPQLLLAALYLAVNALLSTYFVSHESSLFAAGPPRPLRISAADPVGAQTASSRLTLPRPLSGLLMVWFAGMAVVLSQSFFAVEVGLVDVDANVGASVDVSLSACFGSPSGYGKQGGNGDPNGAAAEPAAGAVVVVRGFGISGAGLVVLLAALVGLAAGVLALGLRRAPAASSAEFGERAAGNPMALPAGSCSAVVSARCHPLPRERGLWRRPVMWGVVREGIGLGAGHCGFTGGRPGLVEAGRVYA